MNCLIKKAFTLIELIITIVIIGIAASALPMMMSGANKLEEQSVNQDVFFKSVFVMTDIVSRYWDEEVATQDGDGNGAMALNVKNPSSDIDRTNSTAYFNRTDYDYRMTYQTNSTNPTASQIQINATAIVSEDTIQSLEAYNGRFIDESSGDARVRYDIDVKYVPDKVDNPESKNQKATWNLRSGDAWTDAADSTNLKRVTITATRSGIGEPVSVSFVYYGSNIGSAGIKTK